MYSEHKKQQNALDLIDKVSDNPTLKNKVNKVKIMTLTKAELSEVLMDKVKGIGKADAKAVVELFFEEIRTTLEKGEEVKISGFGNFHLRDKPQRPGRNPKTGEEVPISARRVVTFHASPKLKGMVENHYGKK